MAVRAVIEPAVLYAFPKLREAVLYVGGRKVVQAEGLEAGRVDDVAGAVRQVIQARAGGGVLAGAQRLRMFLRMGARFGHQRIEQG